MPTNNEAAAAAPRTPNVVELEPDGYTFYEQFAGQITLTREMPNAELVALLEALEGVHEAYIVPKRIRKVALADGEERPRVVNANLVLPVRLPAKQGERDHVVAGGERFRADVLSPALADIGAHCAALRRS